MVSSLSPLGRSQAEPKTENCPPSTNASGYNLVDNIRILASQFGAVNVFKAYLQLPEKSSPRQSSLRSELQSCGLSLTGPSAPPRLSCFPPAHLRLTDCPHNGKNSVDLMMIGESLLSCPKPRCSADYLPQWISWRSSRTIHLQPQSSSSPAIVILPIFYPQSDGENTMSYS